MSEKSLIERQFILTYQGERFPMTQQGNRASEETAAQRMFGPQAAVYATSQVHVRDDSLSVVEEMAGPVEYEWTVDLGTGAGFTAFAMAKRSRRVVASDLTRPMLQQAQRIGQERIIANLRLSQNAAESLPFADDTIDLITCRVAGHHFADFEKALDEVRRVLKVGGPLLMADSISPEDDAISRWMNDIELRRDYSHVNNRKISHIESLLEQSGLKIRRREHARIYLRFNEWVARTQVPEAESAQLRRDFLDAAPEIQEAFQIAPVNGDLAFSWPCLIFRAEKE